MLKTSIVQDKITNDCYRFFLKHRGNQALNFAADTIKLLNLNHCN